MPTMTRIHRHSSSNAVEETRGRQRNVSGDANKENFEVHFMSSPFGNSSLIALQDLSNVHGMSPQRRSFSEGSGPRQASPQLAALRCLPRLSGVATAAAAALEDSQLSSSRMGDTTLDRMLDAIIESARKEVRCKHQTALPLPPATTTVLVDAEWSESSIHEMEVRTPTHLKRQRVVRRKNQHKATSRHSSSRNSATSTAKAPAVKRQSDALKHSSIIKEHVPSIKRCLSFSSSSDLEDDEHFAKRSSIVSSASASDSVSISVYASVSASASVSSAGDITTQSRDFVPRGSIELSIAYNAQQQQLNVHVIRCRDLQRSHGAGSINAYVKVALAEGQHQEQHHEQHQQQEQQTSRFQRTAVHRHSCRPYFDERFGFHVAEDLLQATTTRTTTTQPLQLQLAVWHRDRHLKRSEFLGSLTFPLSTLAAQQQQQLSIYGITGSYKLHAQGCQHNCRNTLHVAPVANVTPTSRPQQYQEEQENQQKKQQQPQNETEEQQLIENASKMTTMATAVLKSSKINTNNTATSNNSNSNTNTNTNSNTNTNPNSNSSNTTTAVIASTTVLSDEVISIDSMAATGPLGKDDLLLPQHPEQPMVLSKKALHQRDADENLFLRFLELDPPPDGNANSTTNAGNNTVGCSAAASGGGAGGSGNANANSITSNANHMNGSGSTRRCSTLATGRHPSGRTPFTMTKRLTRTEERGFGFSIVWTHPPRVEKVEAGLSADRCGILPGDYVIFVDKHNVVTMPEADVLNLIRSQGSSLTLEIFRRSGAGANMTNMANNITTVTVNASSHNSHTLTHVQTHSQSHHQQQQLRQQFCGDEHATAAITTATTTATILHRASSTRVPSSGFMGTNQSRPATACSGTTSSIEAAKRRLHLPQVTFSKESIVPITDNRRRFLLQLISREQNFTAALHFGLQRFVQPLVERKDLISPNDHRTLFQNIDELLRITEDILEQLCSNDQEQEPHMNFASRVYLSKTTAICAAYKKYCNGIKRADCVLVNKSRQTGSEFISFITDPAVPRKRPDLTMFIHRPLQHFREILKLMQLLAGNCHVDTEEHKNFSTVINELQAAYREITVSSGLMEPLGEGRPLLTLQDLESRMVFTKCKPFTLAVQGRQWIFGGDLSRVEGRSIKPYWTLLFSDIIVFAKVSRDRVLFITEEPIPIANVVDSCFHMRKKTTEFRLTIDPNGRLAESPTGYCAPDLTRTPKRGARRKSLILRAPSLELKAVWQNLLQRQIFLVNAALGSTPLSSPLDSPDVLNTLVPLSDIGMTSASMGSMKLPSLDSINLKQQKQQVRLFRSKRLDSADSYENLQRLASALVPSTGSQQRSAAQHGSGHGQAHGHGHGHGHVEQIELLIDEKCRILNKTGTPKSSALHLANWMKGQLDKQQQQARLVAIARSQENVSADDEQLIFNSDSEQDERIIYWTRQQLEKRTKELNLAKENGGLSAKPNFGGKRLSGVEELSMSAPSDIYSETEVVASQISQSHSTTSDSQITVRSSPIVLDKLAVCRHCHKNCQQSASGDAGGRGSGAGAVSSPGAGGGGGSSLLCNSLKVQHSQSSPNRCCNGNGNAMIVGGSDAVPPEKGQRTRTATDSVTSLSCGSITGDQSSKIVASSSRRETGDTESDVAQLITDELSLSQSEATDDRVGAMPDSSSSCSAQLRVLDTPAPMANGHCSGASVSISNSASVSASPSVSGSPKARPQPPPRRTRVVAIASQESTRPRANQQVKAIVTITEMARIMRASDRPISSSGSIAGSPAKYAACHCRCGPEDFSQTQLAPDKMEQQTCKLLESPKQKTTAVQRQEDDQLSLMLIGLAQFAPTAKLCGQSQSQTQSQAQPSPLITVNDQKEAVPTSTSTSISTETATSTTTPTPKIAVVPPTPDAVLTKTSTHVWDNSGGAATASTTSTTSTTTAKQPRQAIIENIPEDSCDESPLEEDPPYRPMSNALRRFGTMSSLEKLPSDELDELEDLESYAQNGLNEQTEADSAHNEAANDADVDEDEDDLDGDDEDATVDKAMAQNLHELATCSSGGSISVTISNGEVLASGAWTNRAGAFVSDKMSFFEESRAFIDKYLGRWNANEQQQQGNQTASETDEQMDECTSGATSGEEVWGTPTSGGDNDDMQLINSENTHSSPTKSSTSLNDDDDTELMMDELLMAPPMTASNIRGLLPRRRLEPLFEEETESDGEETQQDSDDIKKGEATTNGHYLKDSAGSSSEEVPPQDEEEEESDLEEEDPDRSSEDRLQPILATTALGPRPLTKPSTTIMLLPTTAITASSSTPSQSRERSQVVVVPPPVASSCEYLLEQRPSIAATTFSTSVMTNHITTTTSTTAVTMMTMTTTKMIMTMTMTMTTNMAMLTTPASSQRAPSTTASRAPSSITTTTSSGSDTINTAIKAIVKPPIFIPPPPPPRRLLHAQTNLSAAATKAAPPQRKSGATADNGCSAAVADAASALPTIGIGSRTMPASTRISAVSSTPAAGCGPKRASSTIIETCLLGAAVPGGSVTSLATVSRMAKPSRLTNTPQSSPAAVQPALSEPELVEDNKEAGQRATAVPPVAHVGCGLSPRLEMRLALNHDILGDEDLICYEPGPDLTTILGHDLSTFHRLTGRDLLSRSATNRVQPKEAVISYSQQRNSKMDTPTVNRRPRPAVSAEEPRSRSSSSHGSPRAAGSVRAVGDRQLLHPNPNTWSSSASVARVGGGSGNVDGNSTNCSNSSGASKLGDLEILARREKIYCMSQLRSGYQVRAISATTTQQSATIATTTTTTSTTTMTMTTRRDCSLPTSRAAASLTGTMSTTSMDAVEATTMTEACLDSEAGKSNRLINFIKRRNSSSSNPNNFSEITCNEQNQQQQLMLQLHSSQSQSSQLLRQSPDTADIAQMSPRKDNDKPSLNRRLWKQITKRRRSNSVSQIVAG